MATFQLSFQVCNTSSLENSLLELTWSWDLKVVALWAQIPAPQVNLRPRVTQNTIKINVMMKL